MKYYKDIYKMKFVKDMLACWISTMVQPQTIYLNVKYSFFF